MKNPKVTIVLDPSYTGWELLGSVSISFRLKILINRICWAWKRSIIFYLPMPIAARIYTGSAATAAMFCHMWPASFLIRMKNYNDEEI